MTEHRRNRDELGRNRLDISVTSAVCRGLDVCFLPLVLRGATVIEVRLTSRDNGRDRKVYSASKFAQTEGIENPHDSLAEYVDLCRLEIQDLWNIDQARHRP